MDSLTKGLLTLLLCAAIFLTMLPQRAAAAKAAEIVPHENMSSRAAARPNCTGGALSTTVSGRGRLLKHYLSVTGQGGIHRSRPTAAVPATGIMGTVPGTDFHNKQQMGPHEFGFDRKVQKSTERGFFSLDNPGKICYKFSSLNWKGSFRSKMIRPPMAAHRPRPYGQPGRMPKAVKTVGNFCCLIDCVKSAVLRS